MEGSLRAGCLSAARAGRVFTVEYLRKLFAYDSWANEEALASLRRVSDPPARAVQILAHVASAQRLWWGRLPKQPPDSAV